MITHGPDAAAELKLTVDQFHHICEQRLPFARLMGLRLEEINATGVRMRAVYDDRFLRPGGTVAGPVLMGLADAAVYALVLSRIGPVELAVTTSLSINFLRRPAPGDVLADARLLKLGKRLAVGEVTLYGDGESPAEALAHVTATYSIPPPSAR
jgi:uncharacterized protein (TIGR00369 family)